MQGTAISDAVNLASRLQDLTREYGVSLIVSSQALFDLEDPNRFDYRFLDKLRLRGKGKPSPSTRFSIAMKRGAGKSRRIHGRSSKKGCMTSTPDASMRLLRDSMK